ncbi:glycosyltransferase [Pedobacter yulinensis]|uniref:Glycosyltransferase n=1 Tax=Pedobacter yulinensis TaxID=2126353 RepID=A0A2T3HLD7_9SPHI|nr:glycosyltransferase [Pedobacter yulinensis]PST83250.1 glycosyltransferase [Pedobacter yulinensis]
MARIKKILFLTPSMSKGGAETQLLKLAIYLVSAGYRVHIVSLKPINEFEGFSLPPDLQITYLQEWKYNGLVNTRKLLGICAAFKPDVVLAFMFIAILFARVLKMRFSFRLISSIRISTIQTKWKLLFRLTAMLDDVVVYNSQASKLCFESRGLARHNGVVIHNGISVPAQCERPRGQVFRWVCIAHLRWNKDYKTLFKAISLLKHRSFRVCIVGDLDKSSWPRQMIAELGIDAHVELLGFQQEAVSALKGADAFVLSSISEGMPNAILEAMAHGCPIVATDIAGIRELVQPAACGFLSAAGNERQLAARMEMMMQLSAGERIRKGQQGRAFVEQHFEDKKVMADWLRLINSPSI